MKKGLSYLTIFLFFLSTACSKGNDDDDNNPGGGGGGGNVSISSVTPAYVMWGGEVTINGNGFSTTKTENFVWFKGDNSCGTSSNDSTDWKKAEVVSASATKLVVKMPFTTEQNLPCGNSWASARVTVKGSFALAPAVNVMGFPIPVGFCGWYGGGHYAPGAIRVGDSVLLEYGGWGVSQLESQGQISKLRLSVDGTPVPIVLRKGISGCSSRGITFFLESNKFGEAECEPKDPFWGGSGKKRSFKFSLDQVPNSEVTKEYFVFSLPKATYGGVTGPTTVSKGLGGTPEWKVTGKDMFYNKVRFIAQAPCTGTVEAETTCTNNFCDEFVFGIPLSLLTANCTYNVVLVDDCGALKLAGSVKVNP